MLDSLPLGKLKTQDDSPLLIDGNRLYTTAYDKHTSYAVAVGLSGSTIR